MFRNLGNFFADAVPFNTTYRCYSAAMMPDDRNQRIDKGGKMILPPSALEWLGRLEIAFPMMFKITNADPKKQRVTHCGVLEFIAEEGKCFLPYWMMRNLLLDEGGYLRVENVTLPTAQFAKFKPQSPDFLDISNPKAVLEHHLRDFTCLTKGDLIPIDYNSKIYELQVLEAQPSNAVCIIETDMRVDFDEPVGYIAPKSVKKKERIDPDVQQVPDETVPYQGENHFVVEEFATMSIEVGIPREAEPASALALSALSIAVRYVLSSENRHGLGIPLNDLRSLGATCRQLAAVCAPLEKRARCLKGSVTTRFKAKALGFVLKSLQTGNLREVDLTCRTCLAFSNGRYNS